MVEENINTLRKTIDEIDKELLHLLEKRINIVEKLVKLKKSQKLKIDDSEREKEIIDKLKSYKLSVENSLISQIWNVLFNYHKKRDNNK